MGEYCSAMVSTRRIEVRAAGSSTPLAFTVPVGQAEYFDNSKRGNYLIGTRSRGRRVIDRAPPLTDESENVQWSMTSRGQTRLLSSIAQVFIYQHFCPAPTMLATGSIIVLDPIRYNGLKTSICVGRKG